MTNAALTEEERALIAEDQDAETQESETQTNDSPWLDDDRKRLSEMLTDEELALLAEDDDEQPAPVDDDTLPVYDPNNPDHSDQADQGEDQREPEPAPQPEDNEAPVTNIDLTKEERAKIDADIEAKLDELGEKYDNGELTRAEWLTATKAVVAAKNEAEKALMAEKQQAADAAAMQARRDEHIATAKVFLATNPAIAQSGQVLQRFDEIQQQVQQDPAFANATSKEILSEARARLIDEANRQGKKIPGLTTGERPRHVTREIPPTVRDMPSVTPNVPEGSELAQIAHKIDTADITTAERLMASLTPEQQNRILAGDY